MIVEEAQVVVHEADQPDVLGHLSHTHSLTGKDLAQVYLASAEAESSALRDNDGAIVEWVGERWQSHVGAWRRFIELCWVAHVQGLMRALEVVGAREGIEALLLMQEVFCCRLGGFFLQGQMHALVPSILLWVSRLDPLDADT